MTDSDSAGRERGSRTRADANRNRRALLDAAAEEFALSGIDVPVRTIAARAQVGVGTLYRHFPRREDLVVAVYRHQVDACAEAGPLYLAEEPSAFVALRRWVDDFVDFLVTKHGLAGALGQGPADEVSTPGKSEHGASALHRYFLDTLLPVCEDLLTAARETGELARSDMQAFELMRGIGNLCIGAEHTDRYDAGRVVEIFLAGLTVPAQQEG